MATKKTTPEPEVQPVAPGLDDLPGTEPPAEPEAQPDLEQLDAEPEKPRDALDYIREQRGEG
uniref:hypothetical protein n=1 Tax=Promicromonospora sp. CA-291202 TaxID=3240016 RepID=UPI003F49899B